MTIDRLYTTEQIGETVAEYGLSEQAYDRVMRAVNNTRDLADQTYALGNRLATLALDVMDCAKEMQSISTEDIAMVVSDIAALSGRSAQARYLLRALLDATAETLDDKDNAECFTTHIMHKVWAM